MCLVVLVGMTVCELFDFVCAEFIPFFEQNPESYLSFPAIEEAYRQFDIEISFKPQTTDG